MKKRFTLLITITALLLAGSGGKVWGQTYWDNTAPPYVTDHLTGPFYDMDYTINAGSFNADNNFGPGESGTISPSTTPGNSKYAGYHSARGSYFFNPFTVGNGIITVGGTPNIVQNVSNNVTGPGVAYSADSDSKSYNFDERSGGGSLSGTVSVSHSATLRGPEKPVVPDGSGVVSKSGSPSAYISTTKINVDATSKSSATPWWLQQFYFMENPWFYNNYTLALGGSFPHSNSVTGRNWYPGSPGYWGSWYTVTVTCIHQGVHYTRAYVEGGKVPGTIELIAGSHIRLDGEGNNVSIGANSHPNTVTTLILPATHYTLMNDADFNAASIVSNGDITNIGPLGIDAVMGIQTQYVPGPDMMTNTAGGTILIGSATNATSQGAMYVQAATVNAGNVKTFKKSTTTGSLTSYLGYSLPFHGTANLGNYGSNAVTIHTTNLLPASLGTGALQVYNHSLGANALNFDVAYSPTISGVGNLLIESYGDVNFNVATSTITGNAAGNATINGGDVNFKESHGYTGSAAGDYGVYAFKEYTNPVWGSLYSNPGGVCGTSANTHTWTNPTNQTDWNYAYGSDQDAIAGFSGSGNIVVTAGKTITASHTNAGSLRWEATNDISTPATSTINFTHSGAGETHWQAKNDISAGGNITFNISGSGDTYWQAERDITTPSNTETVKFDLSGSAPVAWQATRNITTGNIIDFNNIGTSNVSWQAGGNITTSHITTFDNSQTGNTMWYAKGNITTNGGGGSLGSDVTFTETGSGKTLWWAETGNITTNNHILFDHTTAQAGNDVSWWAGNNIVVSGNPARPLAPLNQVLFDYTTDNTIEWHSQGGHILTNAQVDFNRTNPGAGYTFLHAGCNTFNTNNNIDIENIFNYTETTGAGTGSKVTLYAENDILTNLDCDIDRPAPVTFTVGSASQTTTLWDAQRNINTVGRVDYLYEGAANMGDLTWLSRGGYIQTERPVNVRYSSDNTISFRAENMLFDTPNPAAATNADATGRRGNIHTFDSIWIVRDNTGVGLTEVKAENHIWTAMVDYEDLLSTGNSMDIISHMGDIYLGHNDGTTINQAYPYYLSSVVSTVPPFQLTQQSPSAACIWPVASPVSYDLNRFNYTVNANNQTGHLFVKAGYTDNTDTGAPQEGGNIYFTHINENLAKNTTHNTEVSIPFSNWYICNDNFSGHGAREYYEKAGIIGGVGRCAINTSQPVSSNTLCTDTGLIYYGFNGDLLFDAGTRGNIIINNGSYLNFQYGTGNSEFRTRWGDIDMRYPFDADSLSGSLLFLASSDLANKLKVSICDCDERRNNIYLQDFKYNPIVNSGSIFIGADNNIKLQYGGLKNIDTKRDPFFSNNAGYPCGQQYHCDSDTSENLARDLILNFAKSANNQDITSGGFAAVASDLIDVYKTMVYNGGQGSGMSAVPGYGNLHGESVAGYGLYIKTQANKSNWGRNALDFKNMTACWPPKCDDPCNLANAVLQNTARVTFHSDARIDAENQRVYIGSPVLETYGNLDLNTHDKKGGKTSITIQTDSLIVHDSLIIDGKLTKFTTWSGLYRDMPVIKLGHHRFTPPFTEDGSVCAPCYIHQKGTGKRASRTALDTLYVTYRNGASVPRLHTLVADHAVLSFLTDSFDHKKGDPTLNAKFYTDTFKVRNHVELYTDPKHERDGHFELISEAQMSSKDYAGIYARHLHMEPAAPACDGDFPYSQLWMKDPALDVITTSTFGGYGWIHADVHVEIEATLAPGYASLRSGGDYCHELKAGTLRMQDLRLDKGAQLRYSIGDEEGFDGEKVDVIEVDEITMYGSVFVTIEKRCGQRFEEGCYPIIRYNSVAVDTVNLNNLKLETRKIDGYNLSLDTSIPGVVYLCVGSTTVQGISREITIPSTKGVTTNPVAGQYYVASQDNFKFTAKYTTPEPLKVTTNRLADDGKTAEELTGRLNANGEYEYVIRRVTQNIVLKFGPEFATDNALIDDNRVVWSHNNTIYFRVAKEDIASIYSVAGQLVKRIDLPEGDYSVPMERGVYVVTLKDGSVHKVILK